MSRSRPPLEASSVFRAFSGADQSPEVVEYDRFVTEHIRHTGRTVQATDIAYALLTLVVGWLGMLFAAAVVEHWLTADGLSTPVRYFLFAIAVGATAWYVWAVLRPLVTRRINPLYAASAIERTAPSLKNSLVNLLTLRGAPKKLPPAVLAALEQQAAEGIVRAPEEAVVDRSRVVKMAGVCVGLIVLVALYALLSVKDPFTTAARVMAPWADIAPPSRVRVRDVTPGSVTLIEGEPLEVAARVTGLDENETAHVVVTSEDAQLVDDRIPMKRAGEADRFELSLSTLAKPGEPADLSGAARYRVEAGDGRSVSYDVRVVPAPAIAVTSVDYDYPEYTGYLDRAQRGAGDIRGIERTRVTIHAAANTPLETAHVDFEADGSPDKRMRVDGREAVVSFQLALRDDRRTPQHTSYVLRVKNADGVPNRRPAKHRIEVYPDYYPEVELLAPEAPELPVRLNETVEVRATARDPDFALTGVRFRADRQSEAVANQGILSDEHRGAYDASYRFTPTAHALEVGDVVEYWIEATDNRQPDPQTAATQRQRFRIVAPGPGDAADDSQLAQQDQREQPQNGEQRQQQGAQGEAEQQGQQAEGGAGQPDADAQGQPRDPGQQGQAGEQPQQQAQQGDEGQSQSRPGGSENPLGEQGQSQPGDPQQGAQGEAGQQQDSNQAENGGQQASSGGEGDTGSDPSAAQQRQGGGEPGAEQNREPVSSDGADDAEAFDRILDHMQESPDPGQQRQRPGEQGQRDQGQPGQSQQGEAQQDAAQQDHTQRQGDAGHDEQTGGANQRGDAERSDAAQPGAESQQRQPGERTGQAERQEAPSDRQSADSAREDPTQPSGGESTPNQRTGQRPNDVDSRDAGQPDPSQSEAQQDQLGGRESDSMSDQPQQRQGGERSAGGEETPRSGAGESGQNDPADQGGGRAADRGAGETNERPGGDRASADPTGRPGDQRAGEGARQRSGEGEQPGGESGDPSQSQAPGEQPGGASGDQGQATRPGEPGGDSAEQQAPGGDREAAEGQPGDQRPAPGDDRSQGGQPSQNGAPGDGDRQTDMPGDQQSDSMRPGRGNPTGTRGGGEPGGDEANLDYARQKTDLVLDRLSEQIEQQEVDDQMLEKLGWSEDDLRRFVQRWRERKEAAKRPEASDAARAELDAALRSLNLKPTETTARTRRTADELRNISSGRRTEAPLRWRERLRQYNQGVSSE